MSRKRGSPQRDQVPILSVTLADCTIQTFSAGGPGGQHQNHTQSGVRIIHRASGARGESREERSQLQNKKAAFHRMAETSTFKAWLRRQLGQEVLEKVAVERAMWPVNIKTEVHADDGSGNWVETQIETPHWREDGESQRT